MMELTTISDNLGLATVEPKGATTRAVHVIGKHARSIRLYLGFASGIKVASRFLFVHGLLSTQQTCCPRTLWKLTGKRCK